MPRETLDGLRAQIDRERIAARTELEQERRAQADALADLNAARLENARLRAVLAVVRASLAQAEEETRG